MKCSNSLVNSTSVMIRAKTMFIDSSSEASWVSRREAHDDRKSSRPPSSAEGVLGVVDRGECDDFAFGPIENGTNFVRFL